MKLKRTPRKKKRGGAAPESARTSISRREFLAGVTAASVAAGLPPFLVSCGNGGSNGERQSGGERPRETHDLDFDLSRGDVREATLHLLNSSSNAAKLIPHDEQSRARHRADNPALADVPDALLTHYLDDVDLPADALQLFWVTGKIGDARQDSALAVNVFRPRATAQRSARVASAAGRDPMRSAKALFYGLTSNAAPGDALPNLDDFVTPVDSAVALVFHNQEITNIDPDMGSDILTLIQTLPCAPSQPECTPFLGTLAEQIAASWPATTTGGWATLVPLTDQDGNQVFDANGDAVYSYDVRDDIAALGCSVAGQIRKVIFDDPQYEGTNWDPTEGMTADTASASASAAAGALQGSDISVTAAHPEGTTVHGVNFVTIEVIDQANRTVQVEVRNRFLRYISAFVQFTDESGNAVPPDMSADQFDTSRSAFLTFLNSNYTILGIPLLGDDVPLSSFQFNVPKTASISTVYLGSLGLGGDAFCPEAITGSILTLSFNLGLPAMFLVLGVIPGKSLLDSIIQYILTQEGEQLIQELVELVIDEQDPEIPNNGIYGTESSSDAGVALAKLGNSLLRFLLNSGYAAKILEQIGQSVTEDETLQFAGPLGMVFKAIAAAANLAAIGQTLGEVLSSPALFANKISLTQTTTVTVDHDPDDFQFPATARNYQIVLTYDGSSVVFQASGAISPGQTDPIVVAFDNVPAGGSLTVDVYLTTEANCIVGRSTDADGNVGPFGPVSGAETSIELTIKELLVPLTESTQYNHVLKLEYQNGQHAWVETSAPTATLANLCAGQDNALCDLNEITISQRTGAAGYTFQAGGQNINLCSGGTAAIQQVMQNVFLGQGAQSGFKQLPCGFTQPLGIVYDRLGPADGTGMNFYLEPSTDGILVKSVVADKSTPFDLDTSMAWGQFSQPLDSLALVSTGFLIGVNRQNHKMEVLELPSAAVDSASAPASVPFSVSKMGEGTRAGLLGSPVAVAVFGTTILILEDGNQRIQAVDVSGNPVMQFRAGADSVVDLAAVETNPASVVYLDLAVEGLGYMYVLSYVNGGLTTDDYRLDVYTPDGTFLLRKTAVAAARMAVDTFRNVYTLNYETIANAPRVEPSLSQWEPSTPEGCPTPTS